ncbi:MAG: NusG domain II-containing protein [Clostridia bacterium]|nr:NusG domain II-containing protein [Clostridia bacterium]
MKNRLIKKADIVTAAIIIVLCSAAIMITRFSGDGLKAQITVDGVVIESVDLNDVENTYTIVTDTSPETEITVEKGAIYFSRSECENQYCVGSGRLSSKGATAVCLPAKVVISVTADKSVDAVTY